MKQVKICITGGPSGGKTTLIEALKKEIGPNAAVVPEAASILYRGGFPRGKTPVAKVHAQKAIYFTQREMEDLITGETQAPLIICDRGSLDSIAYWPKDEKDFFKIMKTSRRKEFKRYDWILHLETASHDYYDTTNPIRTETHPEALWLNERIKGAWKGHPRRVVISENDDFLSKMAKCIAVVTDISEGLSYEQIVERYQLTTSS